jgi:hypothetical protein
VKKQEKKRWFHQSPFRSVPSIIPFHSDPIREQGGVQRAKPKVKITKKKERRGGRRGERRRTRFLAEREETKRTFINVRKEIKREIPMSGYRK